MPPNDFARWLLGSPRHSRDVWAWMAVHIKDGEDNRNNRFMLANDLNHKMGQPMFWGRPSGLQLPHLPTRKPPTGRFPDRPAAPTDARAPWRKARSNGGMRPAIE